MTKLGYGLAIIRISGLQIPAMLQLAAGSGSCFLHRCVKVANGETAPFPSGPTSAPLTTSDNGNGNDRPAQHKQHKLAKPAALHAVKILGDASVRRKRACAANETPDTAGTLSSDAAGLTGVRWGCQNTANRVKRSSQGGIEIGRPGRNRANAGELRVHPCGSLAEGVLLGRAD